MPTYSRSLSLAVDQDTAYAYLSQAENLPTYFPRITDVTPKGGNQVDTTAVIEPEGQPEQQVRGTATFTADDESRTVEWSSPGPNNYHGELDFDSEGGSGCTVRLTLHTDSGHPGIEEAIEETLETIKRTLGADV